MTADDFAAWRDNPVTRWFMAALTEVADSNEALAKADCWAKAEALQPHNIDDYRLVGLAMKARTYREVVGADFGTIEGWHDDEHERD